MIDPLNIPDISDDEILTRFMRSSSHYRPSDGRPHHNLFMPYAYVDLSVNRLLDASELETWIVGKCVARKTNSTLHGRSDIIAADCLIDDLSLVCDPLPAEDAEDVDNPNHANIIGYPPKKEDQKAIAIKLADRASYRKIPPAAI